MSEISRVLSAIDRSFSMQEQEQTLAFWSSRGDLRVPTSLVLVDLEAVLALLGLATRVIGLALALAAPCLALAATGLALATACLGLGLGLGVALATAGLALALATAGLAVAMVSFLSAYCLLASLASFCHGAFCWSLRPFHCAAPDHITDHQRPAGPVLREPGRTRPPSQRSGPVSV